jgi:hypothetical protein
VGERGVAVHDVAAGAVRDGLQDVLAGAVGAGKGDHGPAKIVLAAPAEAEPVQVVEVVERVVPAAEAAAQGGYDQVVRPRCGAAEDRVAAELSRRKDPGQRRVDRYGAGCAYRASPSRAAGIGGRSGDRFASNPR